MNIDNIKGILKKFASNTMGFQGVALVNSEGKLITTNGMDENAALSMASTMIYLADRTRKEVGWQAVEQIDLKSPDGYVILTICSPDVFLLVKASKVPEGMLLVDINRTVEKLKAALQDEDSDSPNSNNTKLQDTVSNNQPSYDTKSTSNDNYLPHPQMYRGSQVPT
ncbi:MAG: hypothetical protein KME30_12735 [Iphinoe sp. HA4291-MV1]|jgi:predicted regulator of Ras-like GTPase activity (Roadblock/LC7/MglB family)|nr:hypothetical protein [Iphinoe sp. HA4291-MV1]